MKIEKVDLFGYTPAEKIQKHRGCFGAIISIIIIGVFIGYTINRFVKFITDPSVSYALQYTDTGDDYSVNITNFAFAVVAESPISDFSSKVSIAAVYDTSKNGTPPLVLSQRKCELSDVPNYISEINFICFDPYVVVPGTHESQIKYQKFMSFMINVTDCAGFMANLPVSLFIVIPDDFEVDLRHRTFINRTGSFVFEQVRLQPPLISNYDLTYQRQDFIMSADYLIKWKQENRSRLSITSFSNSLGAGMGCVDGSTVIAVIQLAMDDQIQATYINYESIVQMFSQVGALWTTSLLVLGLFLVRHNQVRHRTLQKRLTARMNDDNKVSRIDIPLSAQVTINVPSKKQPGEEHHDIFNEKTESYKEGTESFKELSDSENAMKGESLH